MFFTVAWAGADVDPNEMFIWERFRSACLFFNFFQLNILISYFFLSSEISAAAVESIPSSIPSFYTRTQLVLGPALNVTVREGDKAVMPCIAPHLGDKTVECVQSLIVINLKTN